MRSGSCSVSTYYVCMLTDTQAQSIHNHQSQLTHQLTHQLTAQDIQRVMPKLDKDGWDNPGFQLDKDGWDNPGFQLDKDGWDNPGFQLDKCSEKIVSIECPY